MERRSRISPADGARPATVRAARPSSASRISNSSRISSRSRVITTTPRPGTDSRSPSLTSWRIASRAGVRLMPNSLEMVTSETGSPARNSRVEILRWM